MIGTTGGYYDVEYDHNEGNNGGVKKDTLRIKRKWNKDNYMVIKIWLILGCTFESVNGTC